jgi:hypothetical protein
MKVLYLVEAPQYWGGTLLYLDREKALEAMALLSDVVSEEDEIGCYCGIVLPARIVPDADALEIFLLISAYEGSPAWGRNEPESEWLEPYGFCGNTECLIADLENMVSEGVSVNDLYVFYGYETDDMEPEEPYEELLTEPLEAFAKVAMFFPV